jgi:hypothetical protein
MFINRQLCPPPTLVEIATGLRKTLPATVNDVGRKLEGIVSSSIASDPKIDEHRKIVFFETEQVVNLNGVGKVMGKVCVFPGKAGVAQLNFYATADDWDSSKSDLNSILDSFAFEQAYSYESGLGTASPSPDFDFSRLLMVGLIGGAVAPVLYAWLKSRNPNCPPGLLRLRFVFSFLIVLSVVEFLIHPSHGPVSLAFLLGCAVVGILGLIVTWKHTGEGPSTPAVNGPTSMPPPTDQ